MSSWQISGHAWPSGIWGASVMAVGVNVVDENGAPVLGLKPKNFAVFALASKNFVGANIYESSTPQTFEHQDGLYVLLVTSPDDPKFFRAVSVHVYQLTERKKGTGGKDVAIPKVQKAATVIPYLGYAGPSST